MNHPSDNNPFILPNASVYVPGSLPEDVEEGAAKDSGGGCCGSAPAPRQEASSDCSTSSCGADSTPRQTTGCC